MDCQWRSRALSIAIKVRGLDVFIVLKVIYSSESWVLRVREKRKVKIFDMKCLRNARGVNFKDWIMNRDRRDGCGNSRSMLERGKQSILNMVRYIEGMVYGELTKRMYRAEVNMSSGRAKRIEKKRSV